MEPTLDRRGTYAMKRIVIVTLALLLAPTAASAGSTGWRVTVKGESTVVWHGSWTKVVPGRWRLPVVTIRGTTAGPSPDGAALVLGAMESSEQRTASSFVVVRQGAVANVDLPGRWEFDAVSPAASTMYMTESAGDGAYWVRPVAVATAKPGLRLVTKSIAPAPQPIGLEEGPMRGRPVDRVTSRDGQTVYTLYDGPEHPFVHALNIVSGGALCYDLPSTMRVDVMRLRLRLGPRHGLVDVMRSKKVVAQVVDPSLGPAVRVAGTAVEPELA